MMKKVKISNLEMERGTKNMGYLNVSPESF